MRLYVPKKPRSDRSVNHPVRPVSRRRPAVVASSLFGAVPRTLLQAAAGDAVEGAAGEIPASLGEMSAQPFGGLLGQEREPRILILDDELSVRRVCTFALRGMGWRPEGEGSARTALARIMEGEKFDVVVLDYAMPDMDGLEFLEALAAIPDKSSRPQILMASAHADGAVAKQAMSLGVWDFLAKPLMPDDIRRRTRRLLNRNIHAERGDMIARALQLATRCEWDAALQALEQIAISPAPLLRGLLQEVRGDAPAARLEYARAYWSPEWSGKDADVWSELSERLDVGE